MRLKATLLFLFLGLLAHANYIQGRILFNDGHVEEGYVKSFLEKRFMDLRLFKRLEQSLNLDDKSISFKTTEDGAERKISINDIDELKLIYADGYSEEYKVLNLKKTNSKGEVIDLKTKIWLPYIQKGRINVLGYKIVNQTDNDYETVFYLNNSKENYAINPFAFDNLMEVMTIKTRMAGTFKDLFKDCPEMAANVENYIMQKPTKEEKKVLREQRAAREKEYEAIPKNVRDGDPAVFFETILEPVDAIISKYENECPE